MPAREQNWREKELDEWKKAGFRRWVITKTSELKKHVLTQCKEVKNLDIRLQEVLTRITSLEKNTNDLMEHENFMKHTQVSIAKFIKWKKRYQRLKINSMK